MADRDYFMSSMWKMTLAVQWNNKQTNMCLGWKMVTTVPIWYDEKHTLGEKPEVILPWRFVGEMKLQNTIAGMFFHVIYCGTKWGEMYYELAIWRLVDMRCGLSFFLRKNISMFWFISMLSSHTAINQKFLRCVLWSLTSRFWFINNKSHCEEQAHFWPYNHREWR